jgi:hypothetical protein
VSTYIVCSVVPHKIVTILYAGMMVSRKCAGTGRSGAELGKVSFDSVKVFNF